MQVLKKLILATCLLVANQVTQASNNDITTIKNDTINLLYKLRDHYKEFTKNTTNNAVINDCEARCATLEDNINWVKHLNNENVISFAYQLTVDEYNKIFQKPTMKDINNATNKRGVSDIDIRYTAQMAITKKLLANKDQSSGNIINALADTITVYNNAGNHEDLAGLKHYAQLEKLRDWCNFEWESATRNESETKTAPVFAPLNIANEVNAALHTFASYEGRVKTIEETNKNKYNAKFNGKMKLEKIKDSIKFKDSIKLMPKVVLRKKEEEAPLLSFNVPNYDFNKENEDSKKWCNGCNEYNKSLGISRLPKGKEDLNKYKVFEGIESDTRSPYDFRTHDFSTKENEDNVKKCIIESKERDYLSSKLEALADASIHRPRNYYFTPTLPDCAYYINNQFFTIDREALRNIATINNNKNNINNNENSTALVKFSPNNNKLPLLYSPSNPSINNNKNKKIKTNNSKQKINQTIEDSKDRKERIKNDNGSDIFIKEEKINMVVNALKTLVNTTGGQNILEHKAIIDNTINLVHTL